MDCPKCVGKLEEKTVENVKIDVCWVCEGIWFEAGELDKVLQADSHDFKTIDLSRADFDGAGVGPEIKAEINTKTATCPRCAGVTMEKVKMRHTWVDMCPSCHGTWLDSGEINHLRHRELVKLADILYSWREALKYFLSREGQEELRVWRQNRGGK